MLGDPSSSSKNQLSLPFGIVLSLTGSNNEGQPSVRDISILIGVLTAVFGWMLGQIIVSQLNRRQNTIDLTLARIKERKLAEAIDFLTIRSPAADEISGDDVRAFITADKKSDHWIYLSKRTQQNREDPLRSMVKTSDQSFTIDLDFFTALRRLLNYYEFVAEACYRNTVSRRIVLSAMGYSYLNIFRLYYPFIIAAHIHSSRKSKVSLNIKPSDRSAFSRFLWMISLIDPEYDSVFRTEHWQNNFEQDTILFLKNEIDCIKRHYRHQ